VLGGRGLGACVLGLVLDASLAQGVGSTLRALGGVIWDMSLRCLLAPAAAAAATAATAATLAAAFAASAGPGAPFLACLGALDAGEER